MKSARSHVWAGILSLWVAASASPGIAQEAAKSKAGMDPERLARIPARMQEFVDSGTIAGAVTLVARHGVVVSLEAVGYQDLETKRPMRTDMIFQVRSMTKSVTAVAVMILVEEGRLRLKDPLEKYLPEFRGLSMIENRDSQGAPVLRPASRPITIYDLLTHTSGMAPELTAELLAEARQKQMQTLAEWAALRARMPLEFQPGSKFLYSDSGYKVLGRVIEVVSGQAYEKFIDERIFKPLGMRDSSLLPPLEKLDRVASTYELRDGKLVKSQYYDIISVQRLKIPAPEWSLFSTASDLFAFYQMMLNGGQFNGRRILSPASVEVMTLCHTRGLQSLYPRHPPGLYYGLGWYVVCEATGTQELRSIGTFSHGGLLNTSGGVDPQKHLVTVFLSSRAPTQEEWETTLLRDEVRSFWALAAAAIVD